jgi:hypothetical protein
MKCPFSFPKRKIKNSNRCQYIKYDGVQCRNYQTKDNNLSENHLFCRIHCYHVCDTQIIFNKDQTPKTIICRFYRNGKLDRKYEKEVKYRCKYCNNMTYKFDSCCVVHKGTDD